MLNESLRRRLEALNREPLPFKGRSDGGVAAEERAPNRRTRIPADPAGATKPGLVRRPFDLLVTGEVVETAAGSHLRIVVPIEAIWKNGEQLVTARHRTLQEVSPPNDDSGSPPASAAKTRTPRMESHLWELSALCRSFPDHAIFLDLETCGLAGAALFLAGLLRRIDGRLVVELLLARNYAEERAVLVSLWQRMAVHDVLVTFNGKSFDWPMVHDRSTRYLLGRPGSTCRNGAGRSNPAKLGSNSGSCPDGGPIAAILGRNDPRPDPIHVDMLHHARRRWRGRLPNCKLQTLERYICGRQREGDIPGAQIPAAYQRFVETGDPREMESILFHNALDLVTLLDVSMRLAG